MSPQTQLPDAVLQMLQCLYDVPVECDLADFLITDLKLAQSLHAEFGSREVSETVLVSENGAYLDLSLYLDAAVLGRLRQRDPLVELHHQNLPDFCLVVEGISHFLCLAWNAHHDKSVTLLELELQAEVDKFLTALHLLDCQGNADSFDALHQNLFANASFDQDLDPENHVRYQVANRYAGKYCQSLRRFIDRLRHPGMLSELRRFYRLPQAAKIGHINSVFCPV